MQSIDVADFKLSICNFINSNELPMEVKRMALKEIYDEVSLQAKNEMISQAEAREATND